MDLGIRGRNAIVCASSRGLGKACARSLAREGVNITMMARTKDVLEATAKEIRDATGVRVTAVAGDVTTEAGRIALLAACPAPDILVNNAGGPPPGDFREWDRDTWIKALDANMLTPILLIKATVDGMIARRFGRIVNITSSAVKEPVQHLALSNTLRPGVTGWAKTLSRELGPKGITVNCVAPGRIDTPRMQELYGESGPGPEVIGQIPLGRLGTPREFGDVVCFLASDPASYVTGTTVLVDGGISRGLL